MSPIATRTVNACLLFVCLCTLFAAAGPIVTDDLWWHLKMGEVYAREGPWPAGEPLLHTAHADAPVQHEWLFGVAVHAVDRALGLYGLRIVHALAVLAILLLARGALRRASASPLTAAFATLLFAVLAWPRLFQLRPDLVSIAATLLLYRLLLEPRVPVSAGRVAAACGLLWIWANVHSLFAIGLLLMVAALLGLALEAVLARALPAEETPRTASPGARAVPLLAALVLATAATALNPRGFQQHLTFVTSSLATGVWSIADEWTPFDPFAFGHTPEAIGALSWLAGDVVLAVFAAAAVWAFVAYRRRPSRETLPDALAFGLGLAGIAALLVSVRFLWLGLFPLAFALGVAGRAAAAHPAAADRGVGVLSFGSVAIALSFPWLSSFGAVAAIQTRAGYTSAYVTAKYHVAGVRFLRDTGVEGNLFNPYNMGGFLEYWLGPRLRTFVDGRTEHYPKDVLEDYSAVTIQRGARPGETFLDVLERRHVDLFFGVGAPFGIWTDALLYTAAHLESSPGWIPVSRSLHHAIYLRANERNRANLERIAAYYQREGVPFDPQQGLDATALIASAPDWAARHDLLPLDHASLLAASRGPDTERRYPALDTLAWVHCLAGAYEAQLDFDREARRLRPLARDPLRRTVYALLRLGRPREAAAAAAALEGLDPDDPRARRIRQITATVGRALEHGLTPLPEPAPLPIPSAPLLRFPLLTPFDYERIAIHLADGPMETGAASAGGG